MGGGGIPGSIVVNVMTFAVLAVEGWGRILFDVNTGGDHDFTGRVQQL